MPALTLRAQHRDDTGNDTDEPQQDVNADDGQKGRIVGSDLDSCDGGWLSHYSRH
jgi:hypothetical protein